MVPSHDRLVYCDRLQHYRRIHGVRRPRPCADRAVRLGDDYPYVKQQKGSKRCSRIRDAHAQPFDARAYVDTCPSDRVYPHAVWMDRQ